MLSEQSLMKYYGKNNRHYCLFTRVLNNLKRRAPSPNPAARCFANICPQTKTLKHTFCFSYVENELGMKHSLCCLCYGHESVCL